MARRANRTLKRRRDIPLKGHDKSFTRRPNSWKYAYTRRGTRSWREAKWAAGAFVAGFGQVQPDSPIGFVVQGRLY